MAPRTPTVVIALRREAARDKLAAVLRRWRPSALDDDPALSPDLRDAFDVFDEEHGGVLTRWALGRGPGAG